METDDTATAIGLAIYEIRRLADRLEKNLTKSSSKAFKALMAVEKRRKERA